MIETIDQWGIEYVTIENDGHFTTMLKSVYDAQVEHLTEKPTDEAKAK